MKKSFLISILLVIGVAIFAQDSEVTEPVKDFSWIWTALTGVLTIIVTFFKVQYDKVKGKFKEVVKLGLETSEAGAAAMDLADYTIKSADDNVFTTEEKAGMKSKAETFKNEWADVKAQWKILWGKVTPDA